MTWLMIKQHQVTGLKYLCKTENKDPIKYNGSGLYWKRHLKEHGSDVVTIWHEQFDADEVEEVALFISDEMNVVDSPEWANLKRENGLDGGRDPGFEGFKDFSPEFLKAASDRMKISNPMADPKVRSKHAATMKCDERKARLSKSKMGNTNVRGRSWYNDGIKTGMFFECPEGWSKGRLDPHWNHKRKSNAPTKTNR